MTIAFHLSGTLLPAALFFLVTLPHAHGQSHQQICQRLVDQKGRVQQHIQNQRGSANKFERLDALFHEIRFKIDDLERSYFEHGCDEADVLSRSAQRKCLRLNRALDANYTQLERIDMQRELSAGYHSDLDLQLQEIEDDLALYGCHAVLALERESSPSGQSNQIRPEYRAGNLDHPADIRSNNGLKLQFDLRARTETQTSSGTLFRTYCVRECDGFYFPISFSVGKDMFDQDLQTCNKRCPGATAELYFAQSPHGDDKSMISVYGGTYSEHPNAYRYRKESVKQCSCKRANRQGVFTDIKAGTLSTQNDTADNLRADGSTFDLGRIESSLAGGPQTRAALPLIDIGQPSEKQMLLPKPRPVQFAQGDETRLPPKKFEIKGERKFSAGRKVRIIDPLLETSQ